MRLISNSIPFCQGMTPQAMTAVLKMKKLGVAEIQASRRLD
jgi:hypothetical protein